MRNNYAHHLGMILKKSEDLCGLHTLYSTKRLIDMGIKEFIPNYLNYLEDCGFEDDNFIVNLSTNLERLMPSFLYNFKKINFHNDRVLPLDGFIGLDKLLKVTYSLQNKNGFSKDINLKLQILTELLEYFEIESPTALSNIGYRYVRLLVVLILLGYKFGLCVIAEFICNQILIYFKLQNSGEYSTLERNSRGTYSRTSRVEEDRRTARPNRKTGNTHRRVVELDEDIPTTHRRSRRPVNMNVSEEDYPRVDRVRKSNSRRVRDNVSTLDDFSRRA